MDIIVNLAVSVAANVIGFFVTKWLDGHNRRR